MKKQVLAGALAASIAAVAIAGASLAYFTDTETKDNNFSIGKVNITLTEDSWGVEDDLENVYPGEPLAKDPNVVNETENPVFVRIKVEGLSEDVFSRYQWADGYNTAKWQYNGADGCYYYYDAENKTGILDGKAETGVLFDQIVLSKNVGNDMANKAMSVKVTAEAIQAQGARATFGEPGKEGDTVYNMDVAAIAAWFNGKNIEAAVDVAVDA